MVPRWLGRVLHGAVQTRVMHARNQNKALATQSVHAVVTLFSHACPQRREEKCQLFGRQQAQPHVV